MGEFWGSPPLTQRTAVPSYSLIDRYSHPILDCPVVMVLWTHISVTIFINMDIFGDTGAIRRDANVILTATSISGAGNWFSYMALGLVSYKLAGFTGFAFVALIRLLGNILFAPVVGVLTSRITAKRPVVVLADALRACTLGIIAWRGHLGLVSDLIMVGLLSFGDQLFSQSFWSILSSLFPNESARQKISEQLETIAGVAMIIGPVTASVALQHFSVSVVLLIDAGSYMLSGTLFLFIRNIGPDPVDLESKGRIALVKSIQLLLQKSMLALTIFMALFYGVMAIYSAIDLSYVLHALRLSILVYGYASAAWGVGLGIFSWLPWISVSTKGSRGILLGFLGQGAGLLLYAMSNGILWVIGSNLIVGMFNAVLFARYKQFIFRITNPSNAGTVAALQKSIFYAAAVIGNSFTLIFVNHLSLRYLMGGLGGGLFLIGGGFAVAFWPQVRGTL